MKISITKKGKTSPTMTLSKTPTLVPSKYGTGKLAATTNKKYS